MLHFYRKFSNSIIAGEPSIGGEYKGEGNMVNSEGNQTGPRRDPNTMDVNRERERDIMCYVCGKWDYMAKNCWEKHKERIVEMPQKLAKENEG